jgi:hypothetical protein
VVDGFTITGVAPSTNAFDHAEATAAPLTVRAIEPPVQYAAQMPFDLSIVRFRARSGSAAGPLGKLCAGGRAASDKCVPVIAGTVCMDTKRASGACWTRSGPNKGLVNKIQQGRRPLTGWRSATRRSSGSGRVL